MVTWSRYMLALLLNDHATSQVGPVLRLHWACARRGRGPSWLLLESSVGSGRDIPVIFFTNSLYLYLLPHGCINSWFRLFVKEIVCVLNLAILRLWSDTAPFCSRMNEPQIIGRQLTNESDQLANVACSTLVMSGIHLG